MQVQINREADVVSVLVKHPRIDGENYILRALTEGNYFQSGIRVIEIDLASVEHLNSLGITEFVSIHRRIEEFSDGETVLRLINVERKVNAILDLVEMHKIAEIQLRED